MASVGSLASVAFVYAFKLTYVANVAVIYAAAPFVAAGLGWWIMREVVLPRTLVAGGTAMVAL